MGFICNCTFVLLNCHSSCFLCLFILIVAIHFCVIWLQGRMPLIPTYIHSQFIPLLYHILLSFLSNWLVRLMEPFHWWVAYLLTWIISPPPSLPPEPHSDVFQFSKTVFMVLLYSSFISILIGAFSLFNLTCTHTQTCLSFTCYHVYYVIMYISVQEVNCIHTYINPIHLYTA